MSDDKTIVESAYNTWHNSLPIDTETNTPWHNYVKRYLDPVRDLLGRRVLEIGCGRGGFSCWLARHQSPPVELVAADFSSAAVEKGRTYAEEQGITGITWKVADIQQIPDEDESFDTVISCETIEHVPEPRVAVRELARVLKPGGRLFLTTPNYLGPFGLYRAYLRLCGRRWTEVGQPINKFVILPLTMYWVSREGLYIQVADSTELSLPVPGRHPLHLKQRKNLRFFQKWIGLQSCVIAEKR